MVSVYQTRVIVLFVSSVASHVLCIVVSSVIMSLFGAL